MENLKNLITTQGPEILLGLVVFVVLWVIINSFTKALGKAINKKGVDPTLAPFVSTMIQLSLKIALLLSLASHYGIKTTSFIAILGAAGLAIGMALKDSLSHFASGIILLWYRPFRVGDYIEGAGTGGTVKEIQLFSTILLTPDNKTIIIPNGSLLNGTMTNYSTQARRRVDITFGVAYSDDFEKAKKEILTLLQNDERVLKDPAPLVRVISLGDNSVNIVSRSWVEKADYWNVYFDLMEGVKKRFDEVGLNFPFPQREVWHHQMD